MSESFSILGKTANGIPIPLHRFGDSGPEVLILGGVHGDEPEGVVASHGILGRFEESYGFKLRATVIPALNLDGVLAGSRLNGNGVDLNRNLPSNDWNPEKFNERYPPGPKANSEPENKALVEFLGQSRPKLVVSLHSWNPLLNINGDCRTEAEAIQKRTDYKIEEDIGYPTPGCLGTYAGIERDMPTITYEIQKGLETKEILFTHVPAVLEALKETEKKYK